MLLVSSPLRKIGPMKNLRLLSVVVGLALLSACSSEDSPGTGNPNPTGGTGGSSVVTGGTAGSTTTGGVGPLPTGGTTGTTGGNATGGTPPTGGSATGGTPTGGSGGSAPTGGSPTGGSGGGTGGPTKWVGSWAASPYLAASDAQPAAALSNSVLRQVVHASIGGSQIRLQLSNIVGNGAVNIKSVHVALCKAMPKVDGSIDAATDKAVTFSGMASVTIPAKMEIWSDPIDFAVPPLGNVSITMALGSVPSDLTAHAGARADSYVQANSTDVSAANLTSAPHNLHWYFISGIDVQAPMDAKAIVAIGDSITDGRGTTDNGNTRWTDYLAARLQANPATANVAVLNQGIGATTLAGAGTAAEARFARDVLGQSGVKYVIVLDGVNDINGGADTNKLKGVYDKLIKAAHDKQLLIYGGTITPFGNNDYWSQSHEMVRSELNTYIKSGAFDGFIDFDAAVSDGTTGMKSPKLSTASESTDGLHPGPGGYKLMAEKADLTLFTK